MSTSVAAVVNHFPSAENGFTTTLASTIASGAVTVPLNSVAGYANGEVVVFVVDPTDAAKKQTFTGIIDTTGIQITGVKWTAGTNQSHSGGATVVDYATATHISMMTKGILVHANQDGSLIGAAVRSALGVTGTTATGWDLITTTPTVATGYNKGNKEFDLTFAGVNLTTVLTPGMRFKVDRTGTTPTQCFDAESTSSQYASRAAASVTGITFTDDFTCEAWINLESYDTNGHTILSRYGAGGWLFRIFPDGRVGLYGESGGAGREVISYQSLPLNQWVHIAANLDMSANTGTIYINGASVPIQMSGTATALVQAGDLQIGRRTGINHLDGKVTDVRLWSTIRTATQVRDNMNQQIVGTETGLVGYWKLNGDFNDSTANANNLTASGGAVATTLDNPMKATEYALIHKVSYSAPNTTVTVFTGTDYNIPNQTLQNPYYSTQANPYGFNASRNRWSVVTLYRIIDSYTFGAINQWTASNARITIPVGEWSLRFNGTFQLSSTAVGTRDGYFMLNDVFPAGTDKAYELIGSLYEQGVGDTLGTLFAQKETPTAITAPTIYYLMSNITGASGTEYFRLRGDIGIIKLVAESAFI